MEVFRLSETLSFLRTDESHNKIQEKLVAVETALQNLSSSPAEPTYQTSLSSSVSSLEDVLKKLTSSYDPAKLTRILEIGAGPFFTMDLINGIKKLISDNPMSPATALAGITKMRADRQEFIDRVKQTESGVDSFVEFNSHLEAGEAAVGFELPRDLFDNEFRDFIAELRTIQRIVRVIAEVETGAIPSIKLGSISSSDPLIFLQAPPIVVASIAGSVSWLLSQWKKLEEIRKLRAETAKLGQFSKGELESFFDNKITEKLDEAVSSRVAEMMGAGSLAAPRQAELDSELAWALKALFARVERGMRVEVRVESLPAKDDASPEEEIQREIIRKIDALAENLSFPRVEAAPILQLPRDVETGVSHENHARGSRGARSKPHE